MRAAGQTIQEYYSYSDPLGASYNGSVVPGLSVLHRRLCAWSAAGDDGTSLSELQIPSNELNTLKLELVARE